MKTYGIRSIVRSGPYLFYDIRLLPSADTGAVAAFIAENDARLCSCYLPRRRLFIVCGPDAAPNDRHGIVLSCRSGPAFSLRITGFGIREHMVRILAVCSACSCIPLAVFLSDINADFLFSSAALPRAFDALCRELDFER